MSTWSNLTNNQYISKNNMQYGIIAGSFSLFTGITLSNSNQWIDKLTFSNSVPHGTLSTTFNNKSNNQFITKNDIIPAMECPCNYSITYSGVSYNCYNLVNAVYGFVPLQIDKVQWYSWNQYNPRLYNDLTSSSYTTFSTDNTNDLNYTLWTNKYSTNGINYSGRMNYCGIWGSGSHPGSGDWTPTASWIGFVYSFTSSTSNTYYLGIAGDNYIKCTLNGTTLIDNMNGSYGGDYSYWSIYPISISTGTNSFTFQVYNVSGPAGFGAELYNFGTDSNTTILNILNSATDSSFDSSYIVYTTKNEVGQYWNYGDYTNYSCPINNGVLQGPDINGIYSCLSTKPQTNYGINCQEYVTLVTNSTQSFTSSISVDTTLNDYSYPITIDYGDGTILSSSQLIFTYSDINISPYITGSNTYTASVISIPIGLSPSAVPFQYTPKYNIFYSDSNNTITTNSTGYSIITVYFKHTYTQSGNNLIKINSATANQFYINASNNNVRYITSTKNFKNSISLNLSGNKISDFKQNIDPNILNKISFNYTFGSGGNKVLDFSYNSLTNFDLLSPLGYNGIGNNYANTVNLNNNLLTNFDPIYPLYFNSLNLSYNLLTNFNPTINKLLYVSGYGTNLTLNNNKITSFDSFSYSLPNYIVINLSNNPLTSFNPYVIINGISQSVFTQSGPTGSYTNQYDQYNLYLNSCSMSTFDPDFPLYNNLQLLYINNNKLTSFNPRVNLPQELIYIDLSHNLITTFNIISLYRLYYF